MPHLQRHVWLLIVTVHILELSGTRAELIFHMREEQGPGSLVGNVKEAVISPAVLHFKLLTHTKYFHLEAETGDLYTTTNKLDREELCPLETLDQCSLMLDIFSSSQEYAEFTKVKVFILDINDNAPSFSEHTYTMSVSEDTTVGTKFHVDHLARDADIQDNGDLSYHLISPGDIFTLNYRSEMISLVLHKSLDREAQSEHRMTLIAVDRGLPPLSGTTMFVVKITDVNDNCPHFLAHNISVHLPRDAPVGITVAQLEAVDEDTGEYSIIQYHYSNRVLEPTRRLFYLDSASGRITLSGPLEGDTTQYKLTVLAFGYGCAPAIATVKVDVDIRKQEPKMEFRFIASQCEGGVCIKEDIVPGTIIAILDIIDPDGGIMRPLSINGSPPFLLKPSEASPDMYLLLTSIPLDFETETQYNISIVGNSTFNESVVYTETLRVVLEDVNDNPPKFTRNALEIFVEENNTPGDILLRVSALDMDSGPNGDITYYLEDTDVFLVNKSNGILKALISFDREEKSSYSVWVVARDDGSPSNNDSCLIIINILDQNDNPPIFASKEFSFYIPENLPQSGNVGIINVTDLDAGKNGEFSVSLLSNNSLFLFDHDTILRSQASFDYEKERLYELWVEARDRGSPYLSSRAKVLVFILDVNDNAPLIVLPESNFSYVLVSPDSSKGSPVTKVHAVDYDAGMNGAITYSEFGGTNPSADLFMVDTYSGNITLKESTVGHHCGLYHLLVKASDQGFPEALSTIVRVNILLNHSISNRTYLESLIMSKTAIMQENQVILLDPCPQNYQSKAVSSWSLMAPVALAVVSFSLICCITGTLLFLYLRRKNSRKKQQSPEVQVPLQINADYCARDWDEVKYCKPSETPLTS
ncbi:protocadherin-20-like [Hyperolius riggenbachi]|uniref:protocadherin-20-like n=1 Tax=Hyperolius riggenbachi TaxID=752182 RepID=UPI0035A32EDA